MLEGFYVSTPRGALTLPALLGVPHGVVVFALVAIALGAFVGAGRFERGRLGRARRADG
jgi:hypothetical protein